jgi:hypothetical protein
MAGRPRFDADLMTFRLLESARPQVAAGIGTVAGGGRFYADRLQNGIVGLEGGVLREDPYPRPEDLVMDVRALSMLARSPFATVPAPSDLAIVDRYFSDPDEAGLAVRDVYKALMRSMRDAGVAGHVLLATAPSEDEVSDFASPTTFIFCPDADEETLAVLMEHQRPCVLHGHHVQRLAGLVDQFGRRPVYLLDPGEEEIGVAFDVLDPEYVRIGGFCMDDCESYWSNLARL